MPFCIGDIAKTTKELQYNNCKIPRHTEVIIHKINSQNENDCTYQVEVLDVDFENEMRVLNDNKELVMKHSYLQTVWCILS